MKESYITEISCANPDYKISQEKALESMINTLNPDEETNRKLRFLYSQTGIENRYTVLERFQNSDNFNLKNDQNNFLSTAERMKMYEKEALNLSMKSTGGIPKKTLNRITHIITFSCTGMYAPGLEIDLINKLDLNPQIERLSINFMGCYAGISAIKMADHIARSDSDAVILCVGVEICSIHFQNRMEEDFLLSNALFADGSSAFVVSSKAQNGFNLKIESFFSDIIKNGSSDMAWNIRDFGFEMKLSSYIPKLIDGHMDIMLKDLKDSGKMTNEFDYYAIHPGGRKILDNLKSTLIIADEKIAKSYSVLRDYGNMSSVTILFVLKAIMEGEKNSNTDKDILAMAFGPGLSLESAILKLVHV